jgi:hypothetical protein
MSLLVIRASIKPEAVAAVEAAAAELFAALDRHRPANLRYGSCRLVDGTTYLILLQVDEGTENPLPALPEFQRFQAGLREWSAAPPEAGPGHVIGSYRLFS